MAGTPKGKAVAEIDTPDAGLEKEKKSSTKKTSKKNETAKKTKKDSGAKKEQKVAKTEDKKVMKKKEASAKEIDKTQSKRLVKPKRSKPKKGTRKVVRAVKSRKDPRNIGVEVSPPTDSCLDPLCPFHGTLSVRGQILTCVVVNSKMNKTATVQREVKRFIPKYERYEKRTQKYSVHNPECLNVQRGDLVRIMECRPLSKAKSFVVIEKL